MSYNVYQKVRTSSESPKQTEYRLFAEVTRSLMEIKDKPQHLPQTIKALDWNRRVWSALAFDCGLEENKLPKEVRAGIISLSIWVSKHTSLVMRGKEKVEDLIEVNRTIMAGLAQNSGQSEAAPQNTQPQNPKPDQPSGIPQPLLKNPINI